MEKDELIYTLGRVAAKLSVVNEAILAQQEYAGYVGGMSKELDLATLIDEAILLHASAIETQGIQIHEALSHVSVLPVQRN